MDAEFVILPEIIDAFSANPIAWEIIHSVRSVPACPHRQYPTQQGIRRTIRQPSEKLIDASEKGEMIGDWHDCGRLLEEHDRQEN